MRSLGLRRQVRWEPVRGSMGQQSKGLLPSRKSQTKPRRGWEKTFQSLSGSSRRTKTTFLVAVKENQLFAFPATNYSCTSETASLKLLTFISLPARQLSYSTFSVSFCFKHFDENLGLISFFTIWYPSPLEGKKLQNSLPGMLEAQSLLQPTLTSNNPLNAISLLLSL